ncbi:MAG: MBL fold metallo-hydrolase [Algiphilus sp.]
MHFLRRALLFTVLALLAIVAAAALWAQWPRTPPSGKDVAAPGDGAVTATWLGVSAVLLRDAESAILIDPFFTRKPAKLGLLTNRPVHPDEARIRDWLKRLQIDQLDAVVVSHAHYDHALDAGVVARLTGAQLLGSQSTAQIGRGAGLSDDRIMVVEAGTQVQAGRFRLRFLASRHAGATGGRPRGTIAEPLVPPAGPLAYRMDQTWSIVVDHPRTRLLHHGSAGFEPGALEGVQVDTVLLGVALIDDLPAYLDAVVGQVAPSQVYAVHWDDFTRPLSESLRPLPVGVDLPAFFAQARARYPAVPFQTLPLGDAVALPRPRSDTRPVPPDA